MGVDLVIPIYTYESKYFYKEKKDRTFMKKPQLFKDLEGFFSNFSKDPFHESDPSEGRATRERVYLEKIIKGSKYKPEDIVGVALGVHHESGKPVQFWHVYLTERGITESKEGMFYEAYQRMLDKIVVQVGSFLKQSERGTFEYLAESYQTNPLELLDLGGSDHKLRVLAIYSRNEGDPVSPVEEEHAGKRINS